ncbi:outer membrane protein [Devosia sp. A16]|uniref:outer membrane protein n=1 Tax=Devosia sp. A16 TaxID=1736675 RepID=UPI000AF79C79|nr:outer membrane protein [Devosia sp. A16]
MTRFALLLAAGVSAVAISSAAHAADLIIDEPAVGVVDVTGNWDGAYIGVFGGYGAGNYSEDGGFETDVSGWLAGVALGANFTVSSGIVAGIVGDIAWSNIGYDEPFGTSQLDWIGSLRGRLGFDGGAFLPYLTAGLAVANNTIDNDISGLSDSNVHVGWTVGAGVEFAATENLSVDLQYRYSDYGTQTYDVGFGNFDSTITTHQVTVGLNWSF